MPRSVIAPVHPPALEWARKSAGYPELKDVLEALASKNSYRKISAGLAEWESGSALPTVAEAKRLAGFYRRALVDFYLQEIPEDMKDPEPPDFRRGQDRQSFSPNLRLLLRQADERRKWAREFLRESPESGRFVRPPEFGARPDPETLGAGIRAWLEVDARELEGIRTRREAREYWVRQAQARGIIVLQSHRHSGYQVPRSEFSGCVMADDIAPTVILNSGDSDAKRIFTLAHELAHLWIAAPGLSRVSFRADAFREGDDEAYCNRAAAAALLPGREVFQMWKEVAGDIEEKIDHIANVFKASHSAVAVRAARRGFIAERRCNLLLDKYRDYAEREAAKQKPGRSFPDKQALARAGDYFARLTLDAYEQGAVSALEVGELLGVKLDHLNNIARHLQFPLHRWAG